MAGNSNSGRKAKTELTRQVEQTLTESAPDAMKYLRDVARGEFDANTLRVDVCKYIINQHIGAPTQRHDVEAGGLIEIKFLYDTDKENVNNTPES